MVSISVCLPVYNRENCIRECIDSILSQTFSDFDLIIIDDGSTDDTINIVESYKDSRIFRIRNMHNYTDSINRMLALADGKYIARIDSDDIMMPDRLSIQFEYMESHPDVDILGSGAYLIGDNNGEFRKKGVVGIRDLLNGNCLVNPTTMMRKEKIRKYNLKYEQEYIYAEDYRFWTLAAEKGLKIENIDVLTIKYRVSKNQASSLHSYEQYKATKKVQLELSKWLGREEEAWVLQNPYNVPETNKLLTVVIPFLNEKEEVVNTVKSIRETVGDGVEIIVINDQSNDGYNYHEDLQVYDVIYVYNQNRLGVAGSRDLGISLSNTPYFLLLDAHMRFYDKNWANRIGSMLQQNDRCLLCCQTKFLGKDDNGTVKFLKECPQTYGAYIPFDKNHKWPDTAWNLNEKDPNAIEEDIPVVLGAGYAASKRYWDYLRGLSGLKYYGSDEAYISIKVWLEGGRCILLKDVVIGHIYRNHAPYKRWNEEEIYNGLLISNLLYPLQKKSYFLAKLISENTYAFNIALKLFEENKDSIETLGAYYKSIFSRPFREFMCINSACVLDNSKEMDKFQYKISAYNDYILHKIPEQFGLFEGKMAVILWLCHYADYIRDDYFYKEAEKIMELVKKAIEGDLLPWNFKHGLCGIGWALLYLYSRGYIDSEIASLLEIIDKSISVLDFCVITDYSLDTGLTGILAYTTARQLYHGVFGLPSFCDNPSLAKAAQTLIKKRPGLSELYYAILFMKRKDLNSVDNNLSINEWSKSIPYLPTNSKFWNISLKNGCTGALILILDWKKRKEVHKNI